MEEAVRVGLVFPRSGQEVFVRLPRTTAQAVQSKAASVDGKSGEKPLFPPKEAVVRQGAYQQ